MQSGSAGNLQSWALRSLHIRCFGSILSKLIMFGLLGTFYIQPVKIKKKIKYRDLKYDYFTRPPKKNQKRKGELKLNSDPEHAVVSKRDRWVSRLPVAHPPSAPPRQQSQRSPRLGLILGSGRRRLDNSCVLRGSQRRKVKLASRLPEPPPETLPPGAGVRLSALKSGFLRVLCTGITPGPRCRSSPLPGTPNPAGAGCGAAAQLIKPPPSASSVFPPVVLLSIYLNPGILEILGALSAPFIGGFQSIFQT